MLKWPAPLASHLGFLATRWWDVLGAPIAASLIVLGCTSVEDKSILRGLPENFLAYICICGFCGAILGTLGLSVWLGGSTASGLAQPAIFLGASAVCGIVFGGIAASPEYRFRHAAIAAVTGPIMFGFFAAALFGFIGGFFSGLVFGLGAGIIAGALALALCFLTYNFLRRRFWSALGRWLAADEPARPAASLASDAASPAPVVVKEPPSPERAYCTAVGREQDALIRYQVAQAERQALEAQLGPDAPKALDKLEERL